PLADQPPDDTFQRTVRHFHRHPFTYQGARIELEIAFHQATDALDLVLRNGDDVAVERDDAHDAAALEDRQPLGSVEPDETVAGKERPVDLFLAVLPAAPARNR